MGGSDEGGGIHVYMKKVPRSYSVYINAFIYIKSEGKYRTFRSEKNVNKRRRRLIK